MLAKLVRKDYYDDEYILNEQEFKGNGIILIFFQFSFIELNFLRFDPYWKIRSTCYNLNINCFDTKEALARSIDEFLFKNYLHHRPSNADAKDLSQTDIETIVKKLNYISKKPEKITLRELEGNYNSSKKQAISLKT